jgi:acyl carrier protein
MQTALEKLKGVFVESIALPAGAEFDGIAYGKTDGWDSVAHMAIIANIETTFDLMLATEDVIGLSSFSQAKEILSKHGVVFD